MELVDVLRSWPVWILGSRCRGCGGRGAAAVCARCDTALRAIAPSSHAAFCDDGVAGRLVRAGKSGAWRGAGSVLARHVSRRIRSGVILLPAVDVVSWIPPDRRRRATRGGHLPERLGRALARELGVPSRALLVRRRGRSQRGLDRRGRTVNVAGAFAIRARVRPDSGMRVLVVDDVRTTGATFAAASTALAPHVERVCVLAIVGVGARGHHGPLTPSGRDADGVWQVERKADDQ